MKEELLKLSQEVEEEIKSFRRSFEFIKELRCKFVKNMAIFPSKDKIITTEENSINIYDKDFNLLIYQKSNAKIICIKDNNIFATYEDKLLKIWFLEQNNKIELLNEIEFCSAIKQISFYENNEIIGSTERQLFIFPFLKLNKIELKDKLVEYEEHFHSFLITEKKKDIIICLDRLFKVYQIKKFQLKLTVKLNSFWFYKKELFYFDKNIFGCLSRYNIFTASSVKPHDDEIQLYNINTFKKIIDYKLDGNKNFFIPSKKIFFGLKYIYIYEHQSENSPDKISKYKILSKVKNYYGCKFCELNNDCICIYSIFETNIYKNKYYI